MEKQFALIVCSCESPKENEILYHDSPSIPCNIALTRVLIHLSVWVGLWAAARDWTELKMCAWVGET